MSTTGRIGSSHGKRAEPLVMMQRLAEALRAKCGNALGSSRRSEISVTQCCEILWKRRAFTTCTAAAAQGDPLPICTGRPRLVILGSGWGGAR